MKGDGQLDGRTDGQRPRWPRSIRPSVRLSVAFLLLSCTDPRGRPVAPEVLIILQSFSVTSPGFLTHVVTASDPDGLDSIVIRVVSADSVMAVDSTVIPFELYGSSETYSWTVPPGIPTGTSIRITAEAWDFAAFVGADTLEVTVQSSANAERRAPR